MALQIDQTPSGQVEFTFEEFNAAMEENRGIWADTLRLAILEEIEAQPAHVRPRVRAIMASLWKRTGRGMA